MKLSYTFPALRGIQAGLEYYLAMCPIKLVPKIFVYNEECVPPELRAQRTLNKARIPDITSYITNNPKEYTFSAITASVGVEVEFRPIKESGGERNMGELVIPMDAPMIINDGQHRRAAIEEALKKIPELGEESIAVVFFIDAGLKRSQQIFSDLNKHAIRPSQSLGVLYEHREPSAELARYVMANVPVFSDLTEKEKTTISNRSPKLFTLSSIYQATQALLRKNRRDVIIEAEKKLAVAYWIEVSNSILDWNMAHNREVACVKLREQFVHAHGVVLQALGIAGADLISQYPNNWKERIPLLRQVDWSRSNASIWEGRAMILGKISKATQHVIRTSIYLKTIYGLELVPEEQLLEDKLINGVSP
jgi:DNA sulfur modification protein DndB